MASALQNTDPEVHELIRLETQRQFDTLRLIASENYTSSAVLEASASVLTNKYSEGYAGKRYYQGQQYVDAIERLAIERACALFGADHANVQPYSGSPANLAVYFALLKPGDKVMGLGLDTGGHLTHGWGVSITGSYFTPVRYGLDPRTECLDYDAIRDLAKRERPKLLIAGITAYPRQLDFEAFASIAREVDAYLLADIAHLAGLVAGGAHPSPIPHADVVSTTTHKTLRGPRGGMLMCRKALRKAIDKAVFPGLQGGPHNHTTAAIAVALKEAASDEFKTYAHAVVANAKVLAEGLQAEGFRLITGGTDNHQIVMDVTPRGTTGKEFAQALELAGIVTNYNTVPNDPRKPFDPSGLRIGTAAVTSRGMGPDEMRRTARWFGEALEHRQNEEALRRIGDDVRALAAHFPPPGPYVAENTPL
ncbi:MAG: serine hydroxymethyltransferase [Myxococcales bacterium]|nr:serine hydroxymethyltransferase [Myxococcales bacterium]